MFTQKSYTKPRVHLHRLVSIHLRQFPSYVAHFKDLCFFVLGESFSRSDSTMVISQSIVQSLEIMEGLCFHSPTLSDSMSTEIVC